MGPCSHTALRLKADARGTFGHVVCVTCTVTGAGHEASSWEIANLYVFRSFQKD